MMTESALHSLEHVHRNTWTILSKKAASFGQNFPPAGSFTYEIHRSIQDMKTVTMVNGIPK